MRSLRFLRLHPRASVALLGLLAPIVALSLPASADREQAAADVPRVLVWGGAYGFRHPSITDAELAFLQLGQQTGAFTVTVTENPADLTMATLRGIDVLVWVSTTGKPPLSQQQRDDIIRWSACGGGNMGFHATADSDYGWAEHAELFGAQFDSHPKGAGSGAARMLIEDPKHAITSGWKGAKSFMFDDEYYRWRTAKRVPGVSLPRKDRSTHVLLSLDETTVGGDIQKGPLAYEHHQPIAWTKTFRDGGRVYYNNMGHSQSTWGEAPFRTSLVEGVRWVSRVRPKAACLNGTQDVSTKLVPPAATRRSAGVGCPVPKITPRTGGFTWEVSGAAKRLTAAGAVQELDAGLVGGLSWGAQTWVLDLGKQRALAADVTAELSWPLPADDYDLSVTTGWGVYGAHAAVGGTKETLVMKRVPHCGILHVAAENMYGISGQAPTVKLTVRPLAAVRRS